MSTQAYAKVKLKAVLDSVFDALQLHTSISRKDFNELVFIAGGAVTSLLTKSKVNDYDLYFKDAHVAALVVQALNDRVPFTGGAYVLTPRAPEPYHADTMTMSLSADVVASGNKAPVEGQTRLVFISDNALTMEIKGLDAKVQCIFRFIGQPTDVLQSFDFAHCRFFYDPAIDEIKGSVVGLSALATKQLVYEGSLFPLTSLLRVKKFVKRGWTLDPLQQLLILQNAIKFDWSDREVVLDQLKGVDTNSFQPLLRKLEAETDGPENALDYIIELAKKL
jgi:hypothetical protein